MLCAGHMYFDESCKLFGLSNSSRKRRHTGRVGRFGRSGNRPSSPASMYTETFRPNNVCLESHIVKEGHSIENHVRRVVGKAERQKILSHTFVSIFDKALLLKKRVYYTIFRGGAPHQ